CSLEHTGASATSNVVDDIHALIELRLGDFSCLAGIVEGFKARTDIGFENFNIRVYGLGALGITAGKGFEQVEVEGGDNADLARFRLHRSKDTDEVRAFLLLEDDGLHVRQINDGVDDGEAGIGEFRGYGAQGGFPRE